MAEAPAHVRGARRYDDHTPRELESLLGVPRVDVHETVPSTLDLAHRLAQEGAPTGTLVLANEQTSGRGRGGKRWSSPPGGGLWITLIERPADAAALDVLSLRVGLYAAAALDDAAQERVGVKWPNDLHLAAGKLGGILIETRWREGRAEWVAIGIGVNVRAPTGVPGAAGLGPGSDRVSVLRQLVPAVRLAASQQGPLTMKELEAYAARDVARGRACRAPAAGTVAGITSDGGLRIASDRGEVVVHSGSLIMEEEG